MKSNLANIYGSPGSRVRFTAILKLFLPFLLIIFLIGLLIGNVTGKIMSSQMYYLVLVILIIFGALMYDVSAKSFGAFLKGARGEEIVARELSMLQSCWSIFHGVPTNGIRGTISGTDFDHIIVGPAGIILVETKNWTGDVTVEAGSIKLNGISPSRSPIEQVRKEAKQLGHILEEYVDPDTYVHLIVAFASNTINEEILKIDEVGICNARKLNDYINSLPHYDNFTKEKQQLLIEQLARLSE